MIVLLSAFLVLEGDILKALLAPVRPEPVLEEGQAPPAVRQHPPYTIR